MEVASAVVDDLRQAPTGQVDADRLIPPDGLAVELEDAQAKSQETEPQQEGIPPTALRGDILSRTRSAHWKNAQICSITRIWSASVRSL